MTSSATTVMDLYGFEIQPTVQQQAERLECDATCERETYTWKPCVEKSKLPAEGKAKDMVRKGVPPTLRTWVWMETSGAAKKKASVMAANYYQNMVLAGAQSKFLKEIEQDIPHTFPNHSWLESGDGQEALRRVLSAYSVHNTRIGYCRSMNNIVAMLLVCMNRNEENAFWLLAALVEDILHPSTYSKNLEGCQVEMKALDELMSHKLPRLYQHFQQLDVDISIIATDWYLCLFGTSLPSESVARVWDSLFNEGPKIIFRVALALLKMHEEVILRADNAGDVLVTVRQAAVHMHHRDALMSVAFDGVGSLPMAVIEKYREQRQQEVEQAIAEREALRRRQGLKEALSERQRQQEKELEPDMEMMKLDEKLEVLAKGAAKNVKEGFGKLMGHLTVLKDNMQQAAASRKAGDH